MHVMPTAHWATNSRILELGKIMTKKGKLNKGFKVKNGILISYKGNWKIYI